MFNNEVIVVDSIFSKNNPNIISFDLIEYNNFYYAGLNLYKNFLNYLTTNKFDNVMKFSSYIEAQAYFNNFAI